MKKILSIIAIITVLCTYVAFALGSSDDEATVEKSDVTVATNVETTAKSENHTESSKNKTVHVGEKLTAGGLEINYVSCDENYTNYKSFATPDTGKKVIRIYFECNNVGDGDEYITSYSFRCYADNEECDRFYYAEDSDTLSASLSSGRTTKGSLYFVVPENASSVEVEYETSFWTNAKALFIVK